ncbi:AAA family ATPase [Halopseudomonas pachastrellae]|nr:AAA family ATPase [Halopseudomonas pachastrellae]
MHLQRIRAANFRAFGDGAQSPALDWELSPGLNILVGENDSGKTSVIDAIRYVLWTTSLNSFAYSSLTFISTGQAELDHCS